jgi:hypothetical protein
MENVSFSILSHSRVTVTHATQEQRAINAGYANEHKGTQDQMNTAVSAPDATQHLVMATLAKAYCHERRGGVTKKRGFRLVTGFIPLEYKPQQVTITWNSLLNNFQIAPAVYWSSSEAKWTKSSSWSNQNLLNFNSNSLLWARTRPGFELPLVSWTASHCSVSCGLRYLAYSVLAWAAKKSAIVPRWSVTVDSLQREQQSAMSLVSAVAESCLGHVHVSGSLTRHITVHDMLERILNSYKLQYIVRFPMDYSCGVRIPLQTKKSQNASSLSFAHDCRRTLIRGEYGYPEGSPNTKSHRGYSSLQLPQRTPRRPTNEPHGATRQQTIAKTLVKRSAYQILSLSCSLVFKV